MDKSPNNNSDNRPDSRGNISYSHGDGQQQIIAYWLFVMCAMVFIMVILGGVTRLTHSGLSMVDWRPITGWLPPLNDAEWQAVFELYKQSPEFRKVNFDLDVEGFKSIFWLEFTHRLWGRAMGVVFIVPFLFFLVKGWISRPMAPRLILIFILGGFQGLLGWYMVKSGLIDRPDVSQYRLTAHFSAAVLIYGYMFWVALSLIKQSKEALGENVKSLAILTRFTVVWIFVTMMSGGFVAGLDAGLTYNAFPLMDGHLIPDNLFVEDPWYLNFFENITTVQFNHRILAEITFVLVLIIWFKARRLEIEPALRRNINLFTGMALIQVALGITTLLLVVPIIFAALHQAGAILLLTFALMVVHEWFGKKIR
ncbi:MAG: heme A synthase [Rhodospirillaceae bacterium]|nr:heme A synthase [Rhodospirillaceae bacterium]